MKRQFVRIQPSKVNSDPQQGAAHKEWLPAEAQAKAASAPSREAPMQPTPQVHNAMGQGLPLRSSWNGAIPQAPGIAPNSQQYLQTRANPWAPEQEMKTQQAAVYGPVTEPVLDRNTAQGPINPARAGAWSYAPATGQAPVQQSPVTQTAVPFIAPPASTRPPQGPPAPQGMSPWQQQMLRPDIYPSNQSYANYAAGTQTPLVRQLPGQSVRNNKKRRFPIWARIAVALLTVLLVAIGSGLWYYQSNFAAPLTKITGQQAAHIGNDGQSTYQIAATGNGIGTKRVNILLLGSDNDGKNTAPLAQTDIVVTIDPQTHYVGMLSIPRDLRVVIPDNGTGKLDAAFSFGWTNEHVGPTPFSNAAGLSIATIEKNFGIPINYYAWVGLDGFVKVINTAGGVDIDAIHPITDNAYPDDVNTANHFDYKRLYIPPGPQHMNGIQALEYVRTRHADLVGDFGRSARQQQILNQLKTKLDTPSIITKLPELANDLGDAVKTDMSIQDIVNFMNFARTLDTNKIDRLILSPPYSAMANDNTGDFLPDCAMITPKIAQMFALGNSANCITTANANNGNAPGLASIQPAAPASSTGATLYGSANQSVQSFSQINTMSLAQNNRDMFGIHSLLDMMFLVVFNSFDATKV